MAAQRVYAQLWPLHLVAGLRPAGRQQRRKMVRRWRERGRLGPTRINWNPRCSLNRVQASSFHHVADSQERLEPLVKKVTQEVTEAEENSAGAATGAGLAATTP